MHVLHFFGTYSCGTIETAIRLGLAEFGNDFIPAHSGMNGAKIIVADAPDTRLRIVGLAAEMPFHNGLRCEERNRRQRQQIDPKSPPCEERLLEFQANDRLYLSPPKRVHRTPSSAPTRYS